MIEVRVVPIARRMALEAVVRKSGGLVVGIVRIQIILFMTGPAVRGQVIEIAVGMTLGTIHGHVRTGQREVGIAVIKGGRFPG